jgi:pyruvate, orthophosphate dikinase
MPSQDEWETVFVFGCGAAASRGATAEAVGNKAAGLIRMAKAGLPVPPGFVLPTTLCREYYRHGRRLPENLLELLAKNIKQLEQATGQTFGGDRHPLLGDRPRT